MQPAVAARRTRRSFPCLVLFKVLLILGFVPPLLGRALYAQTDFIRIYGSEDQTIPTPAFVGSLGQKDTAALQELIDYVKAVNITAWKGMQASGTLTDGAGNTNQATLTILDGDHFRLDVENSKGQRSTRLSGNYGEIVETDGKSFRLPPATAEAGLLAFPSLLASTFPTSNTSFIDRGQVQIEGKMLHRITLEENASSNEISAEQRETNVTDLYFDPASHLLLKSASAVQLDLTDPERYLIVVTYGGYQHVQGSFLPLKYDQSLNGRHQWSLQLSNPNLQPAVDTSYFQF
jgi:hypothetical protein